MSSCANNFGAISSVLFNIELLNLSIRKGKLQNAEFIQLVLKPKYKIAESLSYQKVMIFYYLV